MAMGEEEIDLADRGLLDQPAAQLANAGAGVENDNAAAAPDLGAYGVAAGSLKIPPRCRESSANTPESH